MCACVSVYVRKKNNCVGGGHVVKSEELFSPGFFVFLFFLLPPFLQFIFHGASWEISLREVGKCSELGWGEE